MTCTGFTYLRLIDEMSRCLCLHCYFDNAEDEKSFLIKCDSGGMTATIVSAISLQHVLQDELQVALLHVS